MKMFEPMLKAFLKRSHQTQTLQTRNGGFFGMDSFPHNEIIEVGEKGEIGGGCKKCDLQGNV
jgi:hypothetical protein